MQWFAEFNSNNHNYERDFSMTLLERNPVSIFDLYCLLKSKKFTFIETTTRTLEG